MTLNEAKELKQGQNIFYKNVDCFPEQVEVSSIKYNNDGKIEIHLVDNCYIPERDIENYIFLTFDECKKYEFDMENGNMQGHWTGKFSYNDGVTFIDFTEDVTAKKLVMKPLVGMYLKKQQAKYIQDLREALEAKR